MSPQLCLGTAQFGLSYGITNTHGLVKETEVQALLRDASSAGISWLDTAQAYGEAESVLGRTIEVGNDFKFISKLAKQINPIFTPKDFGLWDRLLDGTLTRLRIPCLDVLLLHSSEDLRKQGSQFLRQWLVAVKASGLVKRLGVSIYEASELDGIADELLDVVQLPLSLYDQRLSNDGTITRLCSRGCAVHARGVFLQGLFFKPIENSNNSTPISAGSSRSPISSDIPITVNR